MWNKWTLNPSAPLVSTTKVHWIYALWLHGHNRLQSVMTKTHASNDSTKVANHLLINISTWGSSVVGSQSSAQNNSKEVNKWNFCKNQNKLFSLLEDQRSVGRCFERSEWTKRPSATIFIVDEPSDINYDLWDWHVDRVGCAERALPKYFFSWHGHEKIYGPQKRSEASNDPAEDTLQQIRLLIVSLTDKIDKLDADSRKWHDTIYVKLEHLGERTKTLMTSVKWK